MCACMMCDSHMPARGFPHHEAIQACRVVEVEEPPLVAHRGQVLEPERAPLVKVLDDRVLHTTGEQRG